MGPWLSPQLAIVQPNVSQSAQIALSPLNNRPFDSPQDLYKGSLDKFLLLSPDEVPTQELFLLLLRAHSAPQLTRPSKHPLPLSGDGGWHFASFVPGGIDPG
jgi:hypothetical protein